MQLTDDLELRGDHVHEDGDHDPEQDDRQRKDAKACATTGRLGEWCGLATGVAGHADFTRQ